MSVNLIVGVAGLTVGTATLSTLNTHLVMMAGTTFLIAYLSKGMRRYKTPRR